MQTKKEYKTLRGWLADLDPNLIVEGTDGEELSTEALYAEIENILNNLSEDEIDEFGAFLSVEFFDITEDEIEDEYFDKKVVLNMIKELGEESYGFILDLLLPEDFESSADYTDDGNYEEETEEDLGLEEGVSRVMKAKNRNLKQRKFFQKSAATLRKERADRMKKNRINRAARKGYQRVNKAKIASYQKSRAKFMKKGKHFAKIRRQAGGEA